MIINIEIPTMDRGDRRAGLSCARTGGRGAHRFRLMSPVGWTAGRRRGATNGGAPRAHTHKHHASERPPSSLCRAPVA